MFDLFLVLNELVIGYFFDQLQVTCHVEMYLIPNDLKEEPVTSRSTLP